MERIPRGSSPRELRSAFQRREGRGDIITQGAAGEILVGAGIGSNPAWGTELVTLTLLTVDNITIDGATIVSDTGAIGFGNENLTTTGTIAGVNVTSGENPGHTHTGTSLSGIDISDDTNLAVTSPITLTDDTVGLDQSAVDHGSIGGLGDDDHTIYSLADGTRAFSGVVVGVDPTASNHLATKEYVDSAISFIEEFFLTDTASGIGSYFNMVDQSTGEAESSDTTGSITQTDGQALTEWITVVGVPGITNLEHGIYSVHVHVEKTGGGARDVQVYFEVHTRTHPGGSETLRVTSEISGLITSKGSINLHATLAADVVINATDRLVIKFFANGVSGGNNATIILYSEGTNSSHFSVPISSEVLSTIFLRQDGTKALTGNMAVDPGVTIDGRDIRLDGQDLDTLVSIIGKVKIDTNATVNYLGAAYNDGALRTSTGISYADGGDFVTLTTNDGEIVHDSLSGYDSNDHIDHSTVSVSSGSGLTGGGTIDGNQTLALDINGLAVATIAAGDFVPFWDITATATNKKITFTNFEAALTHDNLISGTIVGHDTTATGANLTSLTDDSMVDALHRHSELSASDGTPNAVLSVDAAGQIGILKAPEITFDIAGRMRVALSSVGAPSGGKGFEFVYTSATDDGRILVYDRDASAYKNFRIDGAELYLCATSFGLVGIRTLFPQSPLDIHSRASQGTQALTIDQDDADKAFIDFQGTSAASVANNITTWTAGNSIQGFTRQEINGTEYWMPYYDAPTS